MNLTLIIGVVLWCVGPIFAEPLPYEIIEFPKNLPNKKPTPPWWMQKAARLKEKMEWVPLASYRPSKRPECNVDQLESILWGGTPLYPHHGSLQQYFADCESEMVGYSSGRYLPMSKLALVKYRFRYSQPLKMIRIRLSDGSIVRGVLALKDDGQKRPLIIAKCGILCDVADSETLRVLTMHLFEAGNFNLLLVGNISGSEYQLDNKHFAIGGFFEGIQLMNLVQWVRGSALDAVTNYIHLIAVSLGGQGALYAALFNSFNQDKKGDPYFNSVLAISPVVRLKSAVTAVYQQGHVAKKRFYQNLTWQQIIRSRAKIPWLNALFPVGTTQSTALLMKIIVAGAINYYQTHDLDADWIPAPLRGTRIDSEADFWRLNDFTRYSHLVTTPTLVLAANNDPIVLTADNAGQLEKSLDPGENNPITVLRLQQGSHVSFSMTTDWQTIATLLQNFFLVHTPTAQKVVRDIVGSQLVPHNLRYGLNDGEAHANQYFTVAPQSPFALLVYKIWKGPQPNIANSCWKNDPRRNRSSCYTSRSIRIPLSLFANYPVSIQSTRQDAEGTSRWLNTHVRVLDHWGLPLFNTTNMPALLRISTYQFERETFSK